MPLSTRAVEIIKELETVKAERVRLSGREAWSHFSNMSMLTLLRRMKRGELTDHGFRSMLRDWAAETTSFPNFIVEMALAHAIESKVEGAYRRGDLLEKRHASMVAWTEYCAKAKMRLQFFPERTLRLLQSK